MSQKVYSLQKNLIEKPNPLKKKKGSPLEKKRKPVQDIRLNVYPNTDGRPK